MLSGGSELAVSTSYGPITTNGTKDQVTVSQAEIMDTSATPSPTSSYRPAGHYGNIHMPASGATKLRKMLFETEELIVCPGVYDGLSARTAIELGFSAMYMVSLLYRLPSHLVDQVYSYILDWCRYHSLSPRPA